MASKFESNVKKKKSFFGLQQKHMWYCLVCVIKNCTLPKPTYLPIQ
jgi:hypothetical protein